MRRLCLALALVAFAGQAAAQDLDAPFVPQLTLQASFGSAGVEAVKFQGVDLTAPAPALNATEGGGLTTMQWTGLVFTAIVFGVIAFEAADSEEDPVDGTGAF